jgi:hypothetical protein
VNLAIAACDFAGATLSKASVVRRSVGGTQPLGIDARPRSAQPRSLTGIGPRQEASFAQQGREALGQWRWEIRQAGGGEVLVVLGARQEPGDTRAIGALASATDSWLCATVLT